MIKQKKKGIIKIGIIFAIIFVAIAVFVSSRYITKNVYATSLNNNQQTITDSKDNNTSNNSEVKDRDTLKNDIENEEATETIKGMDKIVYTPLSEDLNASDAKEVQDRLKSWNFTRADNKKIAYLTFDDGPSTTVTPQILDILKKNNIKATFFVLGSVVEESDGAKEVLKQMVKDGHAIGNHGYCHDYSKLYPNGVVDANAFINDMEKSEKILQSVLGADFHTRVIRFPGGHGSWDTTSVNNILEQDGYTFIDWNTLNGDAESNQTKTPAELFDRVKATVTDLSGNNDVIVVLMHDKEGKETTAESLQETIDYLKSQGYEFKTLK